MAIRAHVIEGNIVVNTIMVDSLDELPNLIDGSEGGIGWVYDGEKLYNPNAPTPEELEAKAWLALRTERNARLATCDWTQLPDAIVDSTMWATYRQELRDLPANTTDPFNPVWPQEPA